MKIKIKQSYHGDGKSLDYKFELYNGKLKFGEVEDLPTIVTVGSVLKLNGTLYQVDKLYDCTISPEELEVIWYELKEFKNYFDLTIK